MRIPGGGSSLISKAVFTRAIPPGVIVGNIESSAGIRTKQRVSKVPYLDRCSIGLMVDRRKRNSDTAWSRQTTSPPASNDGASSNAGTNTTSAGCLVRESCGASSGHIGPSPVRIQRQDAFHASWIAMAVSWEMPVFPASIWEIVGRDFPMASENSSIDLSSVTLTAFTLSPGVRDESFCLEFNFTPLTKLEANERMNHV